MAEKVKCPACDGAGRIALGEQFVSREMASDAGEPQMAGMSMGVDYAQCGACQGDGWVYPPEETP